MTARWFLVHAKTRQEAVAEVNLRRQGYETFLPLERRTVRHARRVSEAVAAYFPGYLFVGLDLERQPWRAINSTVGVLRLVAGALGPTPAPVALVEAMRASADGRGVLNLSCDLEPGVAVRIVSGPFADQLAVVESLSGTDRIRVLLSLMNGPVRVAAPAVALRKVG